MITVVSLTLLFAAFAAAAQHEDVALADLIEELEERSPVSTAARSARSPEPLARAAPALLPPSPQPVLGTQHLGSSSGIRRAQTLPPRLECEEEVTSGDY